MLGWLFRRKPDNCIFAPREQSTVTYWNGQRTIAGDPQQILRSLSTDPDCNFDLDWKKAQLPMDEALGMREALAAYDRIIRAARRAFEVKPASDGGLTDKSCAELLLAFMKWLDAEKKNTSFSPTFAKPTGPPSSADHLQGQNSLASTSADHAPTPDAPQPSPMASA